MDLQSMYQDRYCNLPVGPSPGSFGTQPGCSGTNNPGVRYRGKKVLTACHVAASKSMTTRWMELFGSSSDRQRNTAS